jgi:cytokinin dehydrogenase
MLMGNTRRGFVKAVAGGALGAAVVGFDPRARSWVTRAHADGGVGLPPLDGEVRTTGLGTYAADFGRIVSRTPRAVLIPGSVEDIARIVRFARRHDLQVAANGQAGTDDMRESHSNFGQSQVAAGIAIDMKPLDQVFSIQNGRIDIAAGAHWTDLFDAALPFGLTAPVFTDYLHLSIGGTLSVGGIGGTTLHAGLQVDNVHELEVVTGRGDRVTCSRLHNRELFEAVLAGAGQCAIIVRARINLVPARAQARLYTLFYDDLDAYLADQIRLVRDGRFRYLQGQIIPGPDNIGWRFMTEAASYFTPPATPDDAALLAGLHDNQGERVLTDFSFRDFTFRLDPTVAFLKSIGVWQLPHPWLTLFLPANRTRAYISRLLANLTVADTGQGPVLLYAFDPARIRRPLFRVPDAGEAFHLSLLRTAVPPTPEVVNAMLASNRALYDRAVAVGGTRYIIGAIPDFTPADWRRHFGDVADFLAASKRRFDPANVLTPGQGMFP